MQVILCVAQGCPAPNTCSPALTPAQAVSALRVRNPVWFFWKSWSPCCLWNSGAHSTLTRCCWPTRVKSSPCPLICMELHWARKAVASWSHGFIGSCSLWSQTHQFGLIRGLYWLLLTPEFLRISFLFDVLFCNIPMGCFSFCFFFFNLVFFFFL